MATHFVSVMTLVLMYPAPRDVEPDDKGRGFFGVQLIDSGGVMITRVEPGSPADKSGIKPNDIIQTIDSTPVSAVDDARDVIARLRPGAVARVEVHRAGQAISLKVRVGVRPEFAP